MIFYLKRLIKSWLKPKYKGQIVFQWPAESMADYDRLIEIENTIRQGLGPIGLVDGHDIGAGEMNVFIHTNEPLAVFRKTMSLVQGKFDLKELMVGYREFDKDDYTPIYPPGLECFRVS
jgi:hypothetical protein